MTRQPLNESLRATNISQHGTGYERNDKAPLPTIRSFFRDVDNYTRRTPPSSQKPRVVGRETNTITTSSEEQLKYYYYFQHCTGTAESRVAYSSVADVDWLLR